LELVQQSLGEDLAALKTDLASKDTLCQEISSELQEIKEAKTAQDDVITGLRTGLEDAKKSAELEQAKAEEGLTAIQSEH